MDNLISQLYILIIPLTQFSSWLFILLLFSAYLVITKRSYAQFMIKLTFIVLLAIAILPIDYWLLAPLEQRIKATNQFKTIDSIIVLGGGQSVPISIQSYSGYGDHSGRIIAAIDLANKYNLPILFIGGTKNQEKEKVAESLVLSALKNNLIKPSLFINNHSKNTFDNAIISKQLTDNYFFKHSLLITSAAHMPRAYATFKKAEVSISTFPVNYFAPTKAKWFNFFDMVGTLRRIDYAIHEWIGLAYYYWLDRTDTLFPKPL
ncbi:YdcF family protein [Psychrobium sp. 1_MG-2023]|uniref:YdcF family protein n=1 Tax=Psychrobium sp. 1_MG-2023 TaxID=3062624 RepID=UPI000C33B729|nr:YdcF family protein [Psychrobium sp. 1_MG-2023]MDP2562186.1 YdcF family protein [Psychrobium sp. 1_MG-2023]PKF58110.1 hypothetical protein CW748_04735 [Alteromonadales bacterium alter-6D02]